MPAILQRFWAYILIVIRNAEVRPPPRPEPPPRRRPPVIDDRFGWVDLTPTPVPAPVEERPEPAARPCEPTVAEAEAAVEIAAEAAVQPEAETRQVRRQKERREEPKPPKPKREHKPKPKPDLMAYHRAVMDEELAPDPEAIEDIDKNVPYPCLGLDGEPDDDIALPEPMPVLDPTEGEIVLREDEKVEVIVDDDEKDDDEDDDDEKLEPEKVEIDPAYVQIAEDTFETYTINVAEAHGQFYFRDAVLDQIEYFFSAYDRFRKVDNDVYNLCKHVGVNLVPDRYLIAEIVRRKAGDDVSVEPWFVKYLPTFGAVCWGTSKLERAKENHDDKVLPPSKRLTSPRLFYFTRYAPRGAAPMLQRPPEGWTAYLCGTFFDYKFKDKDRNALCQFAIAVSPDGKLMPLGAYCPTPYRIEHKYAHRGQDRVSWFYRAEWNYGPGMARWARQNKRTPEEMACHIFADAARSHMMLNSSMIRVRLNDRKGRAAMMNVDVVRTPYFFKDRDAVIDERGVKKRIFHICRPHERACGDKVSKVKMHFRGLQVFKWHGCDVQITVPGKDHPWDWAEFNVPVYDEDSPGAIEMGRKEWEGMEEIGRRFAKLMVPKCMQTVPHQQAAE